MPPCVDQISGNQMKQSQNCTEGEEESPKPIYWWFHVLSKLCVYGHYYKGE